MFKTLFENLKKQNPLIHNITNYVTVNDCANILLAAGASPIMTDAKEECGDITAISKGLNLNIGTLNERTICSMLISGKKANQLNIPTVFDPVGAGASKFRTDTAAHLINQIRFSVIKGNISEIKTLALGFGKTNGVDASEVDMITDANIDQTILLAKQFAKATNSVIVITGKTDIVASEQKAFVIKNGNQKMSAVTGCGCMLSALCAAFCAANPNDIPTASAAAVSAMGIAGEIAAQKLKDDEGNSTYRNYIIDAIFNLTPVELEKRANYEVR